MSVLVVQHEPEAPLGLLDRPGWAVEILRGDLGAPIPAAIGDAEGLVVLGGGMNAYADDRHPWLVETKTLIADAVTRARPTLLLCLGHQLGAVALGGRVEVGAALGPLWGTAPVGLTDAGRADPLLRHLPPAARVVHWNSDLVAELPAGASVLARDPRGGIQAVRYGPAAWGVQAHPEADAAIVTAWADKQEAGAQDRAQAGLADVRRHDRAMATAWSGVLDAFVAMTRGGGPA